jgi:putative sporulation protein YtxC
MRGVFFSKGFRFSIRLLVYPFLVNHILTLETERSGHMELFTVSIASESDAGKLIAVLDKQLSPSYKPDLELHMTAYARQTLISCVVKGTESDRSDSDGLLTIAASAISEYIIQEKESSWIERLIRHEFDYYNQEDIRSILKYCLQVLHDSEDIGEEEGQWSHRKEKIAEEIKDYLTAHRSMHFDGFARFRLHEYMEDLREVVEYAVDEYIMDKQYQEFISLLKYFVYVQEAKIPMAHLVHKGNYNFVLLDEQLQPIETKQMEGFVLEMVEQDLNYEDMIVSTLITVSPAKIRIHSQESDMQVIKTIRQIFEGRTEVCEHCAVCHSYMETYFPVEPKSNPLYQ